jgi:hypothetical protein
MSGNKRETHVAGRIAVGILLTYGLLLPTGLSAQEVEDTGRAVTTERGGLEQRLEAMERALERRLAELEKAKAEYEAATRALAKEQERLKQRVEELETAQAAREDATRTRRPESEQTARALAREQELEQRVEELEVAQTAQEDATRAIIRDSVSTLGSNINESVTLGGALEVEAGRVEDFSGQSENVITLSTMDLDFEVRVNDWTTGRFVVEYDAGTNAALTTSRGRDVFVDRFNINTASITVGDPQRIPPYLIAGRQFVPFGISTGDPVADVLTIDDPLTIEVFETKEDAILLGAAFPTPALTPSAPPVTPPTVKPQLIAPAMRAFGKTLGYSPPPKRPPPPTYLAPAPAPPPFNAGVYFYSGETFEGTQSGFTPRDHFGATVGFRTKGDCGRPYDRYGTGRGRWLDFACPWTFDVDVDYNNSVFDSRFLGFEYHKYLGQIGFVPGMAASIKSSLGPVSLVGEWNGAIDDATFFDDTDRFVRIRPRAAQLSLGYQFDWNPWVETIGAQGTYLAVGYSESRDLAGVMEDIGGESTRVGWVPKRRFLLSLGEWVMDGLRFSMEYSYQQDYPQDEGGTGNSARAFITQLTYAW